MAQDREKALDEKTRKLSAGRIEDGKEHAAYQETQQQLLAIQAEQQQNLAVARAESKASFENNQTLAQAAELGAISAAEAEQAAAMGAQAGGQLNPATQQILSKYGAGQPKFSRSQSHSQQVTKQNITINNNITSNTTNDVKVPSNIGGPLQGRPLQFKDPATASGGSVGKFKNWISAAFARQNEEGAKRDREYRHRESSLTKSANKMMKKLEDIGKTIGTRMDPRKIGSTWQSQLKTLLFLFGFGYLTSNWTKILTQIASIETWFKEDFSKFLGIGKYSNEESGLKKTIRGFLGGQEGEGLIESLGKLLFIGDESLLGYMKTYLEEKVSDRGKAMKMIKFPEVDLSDLVGSVKGLAMYLGDLLNAMVNGSEGVRAHINNQIKATANSGAFEQAKKDSKTMSTMSVKTLSGKQIDTDSGISSIISGEYKGLTRHSLDSDGNLTTKYGAEASVAQASDISRLFLQANNGGSINSTELAAGIERLYKSSQSSDNGVPVTKDFLTKWFTTKELSDMLKKGDIKNQQYYVVARKKTDEDNILEDTSMTSRVAKEYTERSLGNMVRKATDNEDSFLGKLFGGYQIANAVGRTTRTLYNKATDNDYRIEYVKTPREGDEILDDGKGKPRKAYLVDINPNVIQKIADRITGKEGTNIDITNRDFVTSVQNGLVDSAKESLKQEIDIRENYRKTHRTDFDNNTKLIGLRNRRSELFTTDAAKIDYNLDQAFKDLDNLTIQEQESNEKLDKAWDKTRAKEVGENISDAGYKISGGKIGSPHLNAAQKNRSRYAMKRFMEEGLNREQAAGIVGNIIKESSLNPNSKVRDNNGKYAGGIVGWNGPNLAAAEKYFGRDIRNVSFEDQLEYLIKELKGEAGAIRAVERHGFLKKHGFKKGANIMDVMKTTTSLQDSTDTFERIFEGSGDYAGYWTNKGKSNAKFHEGDRNKKRHELAASVYKNSGGNLSDIDFSYTSSNSNVNGSTQSDSSKENESAKSFLEIFKEKVTDLIMNFGGALGSANDAISPTVNGVKEKIFANGYSYNGPITKEFTDYQTYLANQNKLPKDLPAGLDYADWKNRIYDMTGSMPQNLELSASEVSRQKEELRDDSKEILNKFTKPEINPKVAKMEATSEIKKPIVETPESESTNPFSEMFDPKNFEKKKDKIGTIVDYLGETNAMLGKILGVESANGITSAHIVDAVNQGTMASTNASMNMAKSVAAQQNNRTENMPSLSNKKSLTGIT